eukprot:Lithocolla_globosa_v1_NODE_373_length_4251_cov_19.634890.p4 type:complete len:101 gc:universal NODE_373_length_4251_cov_19.634890:1948-2250(+)
MFREQSFDCLLERLVNHEIQDGKPICGFFRYSASITAKGFKLWINPITFVRPMVVINVKSSHLVVFEFLGDLRIFSHGFNIRPKNPFNIFNHGFPILPLV